MKKIFLFLTAALVSTGMWAADETISWTGSSLNGTSSTNVTAGTATAVDGATYKAGTISISSSKIQTESKKHQTDSYYEDFSNSAQQQEGGVSATGTARIEFPFTIAEGYTYTISDIGYKMEQGGGGGPAVHAFIVQGSTATWLNYTTANTIALTGKSIALNAGSAKLVFVLGLTGNLNNGRQFKFSNISITGNVAVPGYSITYEENGHGEAQTDLIGQTALPDPLPTLSETGWIFGGWYTDNGTFETPAVAGDEISENTTLYAKWTEDPNVDKYSVTYILNGAPGIAPTQDDAAEDVEITLAAAPSWEHHTFDGWLCSADGLVKEAGASYTMPAADVEFTAQWTELFAITEGTPANGSVDADLAEAEEGATVTLTATPATDYLFDAWDVYKTGDESTKVTVTDNQFTMPAYAVTVSASFIADTRKKILYLTTASTASDKMYAALKDDYNVKVEAPASQTLTNYDLIVLHESLKGSDAGSGILKSVATAAVPVLNTKSYFYNDGRWGWGTPNAGKSVNGATLNNEYTNITSHPIFEGVTISEGFVTLFSEAKAKAMQPIGSFTEGKEGYTLATTPNESSGNGCAIQELTPAQRGVASGKYLMISIGNENGCFGVLTENGQKLLQNAAAYLLSNEAWVPSTTPTALDNTDASVKAVKYFKDGQLIIEKNGVRYNAMGQTIR